MTWQFRAFNLAVSAFAVAAIIGGIVRGDAAGAMLVIAGVVTGMLHLIMVRYTLV